MRKANEALYCKYEESGKEVGRLKKEIIGYKHRTEEAEVQA